jgi:formate/nitrite transporter FocA (FNT family)
MPAALVSWTLLQLDGILEKIVVMWFVVATMILDEGYELISYGIFYDEDD